MLYIWVNCFFNKAKTFAVAACISFMLQKCFVMIKSVVVIKDSLLRRTYSGPSWSKSASSGKWLIWEHTPRFTPTSRQTGTSSLQQASHTAHMLLLSLTENELQHCTSIKTPHTFPQMCLHDHTLMYKHSPHFLAECNWIILIFNTHLDHNKLTLLFHYTSVQKF